MAHDLEVLLVEDSDTDAFLVKMDFKRSRMKYVLHRARDGVEGLDFLYRRGNFTDAPRPDIILSNVMMPNKDGTQFIMEVRENAEFKDIPILVLTGSESDENYLRRKIGNNAKYFAVKGSASVVSRVKEILKDKYKESF